jgi:hypothetical protein
MQRPGLSILFVVAFAGAAAAQPAPTEPAPPAPSEPPASTEPAPAAPSEPPGPRSAPSLEKRVGEALASRGVALARHNFALRIEQSGERWTASLVDRNGRAAASTHVDQLPDDPEAAAAALTNAVVELDAQVSQRVNEFKFKLLSVRFAPSYLAEARLKRGTRQWQLYRGSRDQELGSPEFYQMVGRDDLAQAYQHRRYAMYGAYLTGGVAFGTAAVLTLINESHYEPCNMIEGEGGLVCVNQQHRSLAPVIIALAVGLVGVGVGTYYQRTPQPIDEGDAKALADAYNRELRGKLGLTAEAHAPRLRDLAVAPYAGGSGAGVAVGARF